MDKTNSSAEYALHILNEVLSTKQRKVKGADQLEFYPTPNWVTEQLICHLALSERLRPRTVVDPCCGDGRILSVAARRLVSGLPGNAQELSESGQTLKLVGIELDKPRALAASLSLHEHKLEAGQDYTFKLRSCDALKEEWLPGDMTHEDKLETVVIMNPPYSLAYKFWIRALTYGIRVFMLVPFGVIYPKRGRKDMSHALVKPTDVHIIPDRPSFNGSGTSSQEYVWLEHNPFVEREHTFIHYMNRVPKKIRMKG